MLEITIDKKFTKCILNQTDEEFKDPFEELAKIIVGSFLESLSNEKKEISDES